jgi:tetratricopeptide (TPR) repeat protein
MRATIAFVGPLSNLLLAGVLLAARSYAPVILIPAAAANLLLGVENLLPRPAGAGSRVGNDGWHILKSLTNSYWAAAHMRRVELMQRCRLLLADGRRSEVFDHLRGEIDRAGGDYPDAEAMLAMVLLEAGRRQEDFDEGFVRSGQLVYDQRAFPSLRAMALNNRAWRLALGGWPDYMPEAEWAAREALRLIPNNPAVLGTLALVLVRLGRFDEAETLIATLTARQRKALGRAKGPTRAPLTKALASEHCIAALIYARTGRVEAAQQQLAQARELDGACVLVP